MKKSIKNVIAAVLMIPVMALGLVTMAPVVSPVGAATVSTTTCGTGIQGGADCFKDTDKPTCLFDTATVKGCVMTTIVNFALYFIGAVSVLMLIIGGIRYTISAGNDKAVTAAKNTIMYAVIGVVVAVLAFAIVNFVLGTFIK